MSRKMIIGIVVVVVVVAVALMMSNKRSDMPESDTVASGEQQAPRAESTETIASDNMTGVWKSNEDAKFSREFRADGTVADWYDGKVVSTGTWKIYTKDSVPASVTLPVVENQAYVMVTMTGSQSEVLNFKIAKMTETELQLVYLDRGGVLAFTRVQ